MFLQWRACLGSYICINGSKCVRVEGAPNSASTFIPLSSIHTHTQYKYLCVYIYICQKKKKKPNEHWTVKHNLQHLRFIEKGIWKASIQKKRKKKPKKNNYK